MPKGKLERLRRHQDLARYYARIGKRKASLLHSIRAQELMTQQLRKENRRAS